MEGLGDFSEDVVCGDFVNGQPPRHEMLPQFLHGGVAKWSGNLFARIIS